MKWFINYC